MYALSMFHKSKHFFFEWMNTLGYENKTSRKVNIGFLYFIYHPFNVMKWRKSLPKFNEY